MTGWWGAIQVVPVVALIAGLASGSGEARKCGRTTNHGGLVAIDGVITAVRPDSLMKHLNADDLQSIEIVCMNPQDSTFNRSSGIPVVSVWTKNGPIAQVKATLSVILAAQDAHHRRESKYIDGLEKIELPASSSRLRVSMKASNHGWVAEATFERMLATCFVFDGTWPGMTGSRTPRTMVCE